MAGPARDGPTLNPPRAAAGQRLSSPALVALALVVGLGAPLAWLVLDSSASPPATPVAAPAAAPAAAVAVEAVVSTVVLAPPAALAPVATTVAATATATPQIPRQRDPSGDQTPDIADFVNAGEVPSMSEVIARLHAAGVRSGLGAFSPPGTRPPLVGLAVPPDFPLPPGYVRHHQSTDDGQPIEAILMFSPDVAWLDAQGRPLALPADRVVPPELAPPGLPIRRIVVPVPATPGR